MEEDSTEEEDLEGDPEDQGQSVQFIRNIPVYFPFAPYDCQLSYMEKVIQALQEKANAILESPTGTGKTLCLLCSTLAWRKELIRLKKSYFEQVEAGSKDAEFWDPMSESYVGGIPKIIYSSRTHSQLSQAIQELKNTIYRPLVSIIGSREQMCINSEVMRKESNSEKVHLCRAKVRSKTCGYYNNLDANRLSKELQDVMDVEDLVLLGNRNRMCPYYMARERMANAELVFMPYNYILDVKTRQAHGVDIEGAIVILDEAHNIERVCEDSASFDLSSVDLAHCVEDVGYMLQERKKEFEEIPDDESKTSAKSSIQEIVNLKKMFLTLEESLDAVQLHPERGDFTKPGSYIFQLFKSAGITHETFPVLIEQCEMAINYLTTCGQKVFKSGGYVQKFLDAAKVIFSHGSSFIGMANDYKVYIRKDMSSKGSEHTDPWKASTSKNKEVRILSLWCFNPGYTMRGLMEQGVRSVIITSGTLSPIDSFCMELGLEFPIRLQGSHVVSSEQVWVGVLKRGCDRGRLNSSYQFRFTDEYINSLGNTLVNLSRIVPQGMLVFFPSYPVMHSCYESWQRFGIVSRIEQYKQIFKEPKRKTEFTLTMDGFYDKIRDPKANGAAFFAVCRGKVSEGLDFADAFGRAVVLTGIPFPPKEDPKVKLKMEYLFEAQKDSNSKLIYREDWYRQQAIRAVNQAIGRVIRHKNDYGAILLCDERFSIGMNKDQLSPWIQGYIQIHDGFGSLQRELMVFFKKTSVKYGTKVPELKTHEPGPSSSLPVSKKVVAFGSRRPMELRSDQSLVEKPIKVPTASLAKLEATQQESRPKSFLDSLKRAESKPIQPHHTSTPGNLSRYPTAASSYLNLGSLKQPSSNAVKKSADMVKKKVVIVDKSSQAVKPEDYLVSLKQNLSKESFAKFKSAIAEYKKSDNFDRMFDEMKAVFDRPATYQLLLGIARFLKQKHVEQFYDRYSSFTGRNIHRGSGESSVVRKRALEESLNQVDRSKKTNKTDEPIIID